MTRTGISSSLVPRDAGGTPEAFRGRVTFDAAECEGCRRCEGVCPSGAIRFVKTAEGLTFTLWHNTCVFCGTCAFYCPTDAIRQTNDWRLVHREERKFEMIEAGLIPNQICVECGAKALATHPAMSMTARLDPPIARAEQGELQARCPRCRVKYLKARAAAKSGAAP